MDMKIDESNQRLPQPISVKAHKTIPIMAVRPPDAMHKKNNKYESLLYKSNPQVHVWKTSCVGHTGAHLLVDKLSFTPLRPRSLL